MSPSDEGLIENAKVLNKGTLVPVSIAFSILVTVLAAWGWFNNQFLLVHAKIDANTKATDERFTSYERRMERVESKSESGWSKVQQVLWVSEFRRLNPEMKIPEARRD